MGPKIVHITAANNDTSLELVIGNVVVRVSHIKRVEDALLKEFVIGLSRPDFDNSRDNVKRSCTPVSPPGTRLKIQWELPARLVGRSEALVGIGRYLSAGGEMLAPVWPLFSSAA